MSTKRKKLSGFTLTEVMTSLVIMSIMIVMSSSVIITSFNIFGRNSVMRASQNDGNNIYNYLYDHLSYASALIISENDDIINSSSAVIDSDQLEYSGEIVTGIKSYYEKLTLNKDYMTIKRKNLNPVYVYGDIDADNKIKNTLHGCSCIIKFEKYKAGSDTITFSVTLKRDGEIFYTKQGNVPILNKELKEHISIENDIDNENRNIKILYTYLE